MTLDALFMAADTAAVPAADGSPIPLTEMPLGAFKEMVERHLGRELTDETGHDLATWLATATDSLDPADLPNAQIDSSMAHLLMDMTRETVAEAEAAATAALYVGGDVPVDDGAETPRVTFGQRIAAIAQSIGLPIGLKAGETTGTEGSPGSVAEVATSASSKEAAPVARMPFAKPKMSKEQRVAAINAATTAPEPIVIDLRGDNPFQADEAKLGGGRISPMGDTTFVGGDSAATVGRQVPTVDLRDAVTSQLQPAEAAPTTVDSAAATVPSASLQRGATDKSVVDAQTQQRPLTTSVDAGDTTITIDLSRFEAAATARTEPSVATTQSSNQTGSVRVPQMAVERVMRVVELQATAPPPRMAVVEIPEFAGLRVMVTISDAGSVSVHAVGAAGDASHATFMQTVAEALETQGFELDERSEGRRDRAREDNDRPNRDPRRRQQRRGGSRA